jgi:hypothetical protein
MQKGIEYKVTGEQERGRMANYHYKPNALFLNKTSHKVDVAGLKKVDQRSIKFDGVEYESKFTIGIEVEKNELSRGAVREYELFCGFEHDGSCGFEAVSHVLPLLPAGSWRTKVFDMVYKAERIIEDRYSPSDSRCGGHITIGAKGMTANDLREAVRPYCGILLSLFRMRLKNKYCGANRRMQHKWDDSFDSGPNGGWQYGPTQTHTKYCLALEKDGCLEFRLPSRFESVKQVMRRYELFYELLDFAVNVKGTYPAFLKRITPLVVSMYNGDKDKANHILSLAVDFQKYINTGVRSENIQRFL